MRSPLPCFALPSNSRRNGAWQLRNENLRSDGGSSRGAEGPSTTSHDLLAGTALPDADGLALDRVLAAESASVLGVLRDFDLLDLATERGTVTGTVLSGNSNLDSALRLCCSDEAMRMRDVY